MPATMFHGDLVTSKRILYTSSGFAKTSLLYLQEIGELEANRPHVSKRKDLESYLLMMVERGRGSLLYKGKTIELVPGDCVFIDCKSGYAHSTSDDLWSLRWIHFSGSAMENIYGKYLERGGKNVFQPENLSAFENTWNQLYEIAESSDLIRDMRISEKLTALLTLLMELNGSPRRVTVHPAGKKDMQSVKKYLDEHYKEKITLDQIAGLFFVNKYYLAHIFKESFGMTVVEYLQYKRVTLAKQLLRFSDLTVEEVARECGIEDPNYFSRSFRKVEGMSPAQYRKTWIN